MSNILSGDPDDAFKKILISGIRKTMPGLIASEICSVQPMTGPSGSIFTMKAKYGKYGMLLAQEVSGYDEWLQKTSRTDCPRSVDVYIEELIQ